MYRYHRCRFCFVFVLFLLFSLVCAFRCCLSIIQHRVLKLCYNVLFFFLFLSTKKRRIQSIQNQLMLYMGRSTPSSVPNTHPNSPTQANPNQPTAEKIMLDTVTSLMSNRGDVVTRTTDSAVEKVQSFFPICKLCPIRSVRSLGGVLQDVILLNFHAQVTCRRTRTTKKIGIPRKP